MRNDAKPRVYDVLANAFAQEEVRTCFALLGHANMNWAFPQRHLPVIFIA